MEGRGSANSGRRRREPADGRAALARLPFGAVVGDDERNRESNRVLLDVIRDGDPNAGGYRSLVNHDNHKKSWKAFKDRLRLKRASETWISAMRDYSMRQPLLLLPPDEAGEVVEVVEPRKVMRPQLSRMTSFQPPEPVRDDIPISDPPIQTARRPSMLRHNSSRLSSSSSMNTRQREDTGPRVRFADQLAAEKEQIQRVVSSSEGYGATNSDEDEEEEAETGNAGGGEPVKMSLMDLLEETDKQMGWASYMAELEGADDDEEEEDEGAEKRTCCVCMVRHNGPSSTPCGHTYCRLCSKELMVSRGICPRCNNFVLEILQIF